MEIFFGFSWTYIQVLQLLVDSQRIWYVANRRSWKILKLLLSFFQESLCAFQLKVLDSCHGVSLFHQKTEGD